MGDADGPEREDRSNQRPNALRSPTIRANGLNIAAFASYLGENLLLVRSAKGTSTVSRLYDN